MSESQRHEPDLVASRSIGYVLLGSAVILALSIVLAVVLLQPHARETPRPAPLVMGSIETTPILDGDRGRHIAAAQRAELEHAHWVDRDAGVVDLPIDDAIDRLVQRSAP